MTCSTSHIFAMKTSTQTNKSVFVVKCILWHHKGLFLTTTGATKRSRMDFFFSISLWSSLTGQKQTIDEILNFGLVWGLRESKWGFGFHVAKTEKQIFEFQMCLHRHLLPPLWWGMTGSCRLSAVINTQTTSTWRQPWAVWELQVGWRLNQQFKVASQPKKREMWATVAPIYFNETHRNTVENKKQLWEYLCEKQERNPRSQNHAIKIGNSGQHDSHIHVKAPASQSTWWAALGSSTRDF